MPLRRPRVAVISLEPWDDVWRRNQHLATELVRQDLASSVLFVGPPSVDPRPAFEPEPRIVAVDPPHLAAARLGGLRLAALWLRRRWLKETDVLWINDAPLGRWLLGTQAAWYDVTDDWRLANLGRAERRRLIAAEDVLARRVPTVVCSEELRERWRGRYGTEAIVVRNGVNVRAIRSAAPRTILGPPPHVGYVGTLHAERLDIDLVVRLAKSARIGTLHLVGPDHLDVPSRTRLASNPRVSLEPAVPFSEVPSVLTSMDVLVLPHVVTPFTLSLDAIKASEYLATNRQVVATPTSGFQAARNRVRVPGLKVVDRANFVAAVETALDEGPIRQVRPVIDWESRARELAAAVWGGEAHKD